jgi:Ca2+-binding RTX toxin-like protein
MATFTDLIFIQGLPYDLNTADAILGSEKTDYITIFGGDDIVFGFGGNDVITDLYSFTGGYSGKDAIYCGEGDDTVISSLDTARDGSNTYNGGNGVDLLDFTQVKGSVHVDFVAGIAVAGNGSLGTTFVYSFENVLGSDYSDTITGGAENNVFYGLGGHDLIDGGAGNDTLYGNEGDDRLLGGDGNDFIMGDAGSDQIAGGSGTDRIFGGELADMIYGGQGNDLLYGDEGADLLFGDLGKDALTGGSGADKFVYNWEVESRGSSVDRITDFQHKVDKIDVHLIDANSKLANDQAFKFIGDKAFSAAGQISAHYYANTDTTVVNFNTDADTAAEMSINLTGHLQLTSVDFIL